MEKLEPGKASDIDPEEHADDQSEDFATLFETSQYGRDTRIKRDAKITGTVVSVGEEWVFVDIGAKSEGAIARDELLDDDGMLTVRTGDTLTAYVVDARAGEIRLSVKMTSAASEEAVRSAYQSGVPVEGLVNEERKGGYGVTVFGRPAFCPYSQIALQSAEGPQAYVGKRLTFRIIEYSDRGRNIVLSRRGILEEERAEKREGLKKTLKAGDLVKGTVQKLAPFGAFVDIGGVEGLVPMSELAWHRVGEASEILNPGDEVTVRILDLDWAKDRISLSVKHTVDDPWDSAAAKYLEETVATGVVTRLMNFGAFVQLEPGIEGLVHISNMGTGRRINHPKEVVSEGDRVEVRILSVDQPSRRLGLELCAQGQGDEAEPAVQLKAGDVIVGTVDSVKDYGVFVKLPGGKSGLLHVSEIGDGRSGELRGRFPVGSSVEVQVLAIDADSQKISLSTKSLKRRAEDSQFQDFVSGKGSRGSLGTLGDLLKGKIKPEERQD